MAIRQVLREADIKIYASVLMNNSVSLDEKAVALNKLFQIFALDCYNNLDVYNTYGLGVYYQDCEDKTIKTTHVPAPAVPAIPVIPVIPA